MAGGVRDAREAEKKRVLDEDISILVKTIFRDPVEEVLEPDLRHFKPRNLRPELRGLPPLDARGGRILHGGRGVIFECRHLDIPERKFALKLQRPSLFTTGDFRQVAAEQQLGRLEGVRSAVLSHPNIVGLVDLQRVPILMRDDVEITVAASLFEWIEGARPLSRYIYETSPDILELVKLFQQALGALAYIHARGLVHWDVKTANCLVSEQGQLKMSDLGNARTLNENADRYAEEVTVFTSKENAPRPLLDFVAERDPDSDRVGIRLANGSPVFDRKWIDLYMTGRMMGRITGFEEEREDDLRTKQVEFVQSLTETDDEEVLMAFGLLRKVIERMLRPFKRGDADVRETDLYYSDAQQVVQDLAKLLHELGDSSGLAELYTDPQHVVRIPVTGNAPETPRVREAIDSTPLKRLKGHYQLGLTWYIYPGARHSRFEHSLGAFSTVLSYVRALYADRTCAHFRLLCDERHVDALLFAALVHDIGHGAYSHYLEEMNPLFFGCSHERYLQWVLRGDSSWYDASIESSRELASQFAQDRESITAMARKWLATGRGSSDAHDFLRLVADILGPPAWSLGAKPDLSDRAQSRLVLLHMLNSILDGVIDCDKTDYLRRDMHHAGLDYALGADIERLFQSLTIAAKAPPPPHHAGFQPTIAVNAKGVLPVESLLLARYQAFSALYWHLTARAATVVLQYLVWRYLRPSGLPIGDREFKTRRADLLARFRELSDEQAIRWLDQELHAVYNESADMRARMRDLARRLLTREGLPVPIFDSSPAQFFDPGPGRRLLERQLLPLLEAHERLNMLSPAEYTLHRAAIAERLCAQLLETAGAQLNPARVDETTVFPDLPVQSRDQVERLYVVDRPSAIRPRIFPATQATLDSTLELTRNGRPAVPDRVPLGSSEEVFPFEQFSPMGAAIKSAFRYWARRVRIFVLPEVLEFLERTLGKSQLSEASFDALILAYAEE